MAVLQILSSAARTATPVDPSMITPRGNAGCNGIRVIMDVTALAATPQVTLKIQGYDSKINKYYDVLVGTLITDVTGVGTYVYKVFPAATPSAGAVANDVLPLSWRVITTHGDADSITYSVDVELLIV